MRQWEKIEVNGEQFIFFKNSLCLIKFNSEIENAFLIAEQGGTIPEEYRMGVEDVIKQDEMFANFIKNNTGKGGEEEKKLLGIEINTVNACNMQCQYCFAIDGTHNKKATMSEDNAKQAIDFLFQNAAKRKTLYITIIGGEPLMNIERFKYIVRYAEEKAAEKQKKVRFFITTNGTILDEDLKAFLDHHQINIMLSLDSQFPEIQNLLRPMKNGKGSWEYIQKNFDYFRTRPKSTVHITLTPYNYKLFKYAKSCYEMGFECVHFDIVKSDKSEFNFTINQIEEINKECNQLTEYVVNKIEQGKAISAYPIMDNIWTLAKRMPKLSSCSVPYHQCCFGPDGKIYPCDVLMWDKYCMGEIENMTYSPAIFDDLKTPAVCGECWARYLCGGQCIADVLQNKESFQSLYCIFKRNIFKLQLYMFYRLSVSGNYISEYIKRKEEEYEYEK